MIGLYCGESEVAFYEQSQKIVKIALTIVTSLGTVMMPRIANIFANNETVKIKHYMEKTFHFVFILSIPIMFGIIGITNNFVPWFFGEGYEKVKLNMIIISPIIFFISLSNIIGTQYLLATARQKEYTCSVVIGSISNIIFNVLLIPFYYSYGAAIATVVAESMVTSVQMFFVRKDFDLKNIMKQSIRYFIYSLIMLIIIICLDYLLKPGFMCTFIQIMCGGSFYCLLLFFSKDDFIFEFINKFRKR
jgi:O-antigen/teichoic acid export membrane protein